MNKLRLAIFMKPLQSGYRGTAGGLSIVLRKKLETKNNLTELRCKERKEIYKAGICAPARHREP
jgi:hypothetical protein